MSDKTEEQQQQQNQSENNQQFDMEYFKVALKEYLKVNEETKALQKALKQRRDRIADLEATLLAFLIKNDIKEVNLEGSYQGQDLVPLKQQRVKGPSAGSILDVIKSKLAGNPQLLKEITDSIDGMKETVEVEKLKIGKTAAATPSVKKIVRPKAVKPSLAADSAASTALLMGAVAAAAGNV